MNIGNHILKTASLIVALFIGGASVFASPIPFELPAKSALRKIRSAEIVTSKGPLYFELYPEDAPWHVANFKYLADKGYYRGLRFHQFYPGYIIQAGVSDAKPGTSPGYSLPAEFSTRKHLRGALGMARLPDMVNPERRSDGGQFHILLADSPHMNSAYTIFGRLIKGDDVLEKLEKDDSVLEVTVYVKPHISGESK